MTPYWIGTTRRGLSSPVGPVLHASTGYPRTPHGKTLEAVCGAGVYPHTPATRFNPRDPNACPRCAKAVSQ